MKKGSIIVLLLTIAGSGINAYYSDPRGRPMLENFEEDPVLLSLKKTVDEVKSGIEKDREEIKEHIKNVFGRLGFLITNPEQLLKILHLPDIRKVKDDKEVARIVARSLTFFQFLQKSGLFHLKRQRGASRLEEQISRFPARLSRIISMVSGCRVMQRGTRCTKAERYRRPNGLCNNLKFSLWGAANIMTRRVLRPAFGNNLNTPRGGTLPSARLVSKILVNGPITESKRVTDMHTLLGQYLDHDIALTANFNNLLCDACNATEPCFPIKAPPGDNRLKAGTCLGLGRSFPVCGTGNTSIFYNHVLPRENENEITSVVDASTVYGSDANTLRLLRDPDSRSGKLKVFTCSKGRTYLPFSKSFSPACRKPIGCTPLFVAGDTRANQHPVLIALHTIFLRYHNEIADGLKRRNPQWSGERIFQEARKITGAVWQKIVFNDYLPVILGKALPRYTGYKRNVDPSIFSEFATAAFRFGHTVIKPNIVILDKEFKHLKNGDLRLAKVFLTPTALTDLGGTDPLIRGLYASPAKEVSSEQVVASDIREKLFASFLRIPTDLPALNIQRGRDHGIPPYREVRKYCKLPGSTFAHFSNIPPRARLRLKRIYKTSGAIDLWVGGILERAVRGGLVGETFRCLIEKQFLRLRDGDRHYYENAGEFKPKQLREIQRMTMSKLVCETGDDIERVPSDVFKLTPLEKFKKCRSLHGVNLNFWKE